MTQDIINKLEFMALTDPWYVTEHFSDEELTEYLPEGIINLENEQDTDWDKVKEYINNLIKVIEGPQITSVDIYYCRYDEKLIFKKNDKYYYLGYSEGDPSYYTLDDCWENESFSIWEVIPVERTIIDYIPKENGNVN